MSRWAFSVKRDSGIWNLKTSTREKKFMWGILVTSWADSAFNLVSAVFMYSLQYFLACFNESVLRDFEFWVKVSPLKREIDSSPTNPFTLQKLKWIIAYQDSAADLKLCWLILLTALCLSEVWLLAQEFPWKWIQGFSPFSPLKGIQQTAPELNTRHGVSCIAIRKNETSDFATQQSAQWDFITKNTGNIFG